MFDWTYENSELHNNYPVINQYKLDSHCSFIILQTEQRINSDEEGIYIRISSYNKLQLHQIGRKQKIYIDLRLSADF